MKANLKALDGLRGLAALYVLVHHARLALSQPYFKGMALHPDKFNWYDKGMVYFFSLFKYGHEAVIVFFVLSGFLIHFKQANSSFEFSKFSSIKFIKKRFIRIYPTLLTSLVLCLLVDYLICLIDGENLRIAFSKYNFSNFLYNFFLIPESPSWGDNFPMWSLKHEWFFYLLYPFLLRISNRAFYLPLIITISLFASYIWGIKLPYIGATAYTLQIWWLGASLFL